MTTRLQYCTFRLDGLFLGVDVRRVQEVLRHRDMTRVPGAPPVVRGLINLRGQIVPAVDLRRRLGLGEFPADRKPENVIVHTDEGAMSLLVDELEDVLTVEPDSFEAPPRVAEAVRGLLAGAHKLDGRLLLVLDPTRVLSGLGASIPA